MGECRFRVYVRLALGFVLVLVFSASSLAQSLGTLWGRISDSNGGVIRDVLLTLRNRSIGYERTILTNEDGLYQIESSRSKNPLHFR